MGERKPAALPGLIADPAAREIRFTAPAEPGAYRLFVAVRDGKGNAAAGNVPFYTGP